MPKFPPPPTTDSPPPERRRVAVAGASDVLLRILLALAVAASLSTERLVRTAERRPFGPTRSVLVASAEIADHGARTLGIVPLRAAAESAIEGAAEGRNNEETKRDGWALVAGPVAVAPTPEGLQPPQPVANGATAPPAPIPTTAGPPQPTPTPTAGPPQPAPNPTAGPPRPGDPTAFPAPASSPRSETNALQTTTTTRTVDADRKLRIWAGGDSLGEYVGNQLLFPVGDSDLTDIDLSYHISTGLTRPDYFDWQAEISAVMSADTPPEVLVFMVGGNDDQGMELDGQHLRLGTAPWFDEYRGRVGHLMDTTGSAASHLYWIGLPPMRDARRDAVSVGINQVIGEVARSRDWVTFIDITSWFAGPDGSYSAHIVDESGTQRQVRASDGVHINYAGSEWISRRLWTIVSDRWGLNEQQPASVPAAAH